MLKKIEQGLAQWYLDYQKEDKKWTTPLEFAVEQNELLQDIDKEIEINGSDKVKKMWGLLKQQHLSNVYKWGLDNKRTDIVLKIENDNIKTLMEDGAPLDIMFISKGVK